MAVEPTKQSPSLSCSWCGATVETLPLTWTTSLERGRQIFYCERCSREHLRSIEGKLDQDFWS